MILPLLLTQQRATIEAHVVRPNPVAPTPELLATLKMPPGFHLSVWAEGLSNPRILKVCGDAVYATQRKDQNVVMLRDTDGDGRADLQREVASGTDLHGIAFNKHGDTAFLVGIRKLWRAPVLPDGTLGPKQELMDDLPDAGQHPNRTLEVGPDGRVYVSCGSTANDAVEHKPYNATMVVCTQNGTKREILASGLRNTIGFDWDGQGNLWGWDQGIDWLGDDEQREELNLILKGKRYGWPFVYEAGKIDQNAHLATEKGYTAERWRKESTDPVLTYTAHAAGMQIHHYMGAMFPMAYRPDIFATMHGSWNRKPPSGYELVRIEMSAGKPLSITPFLMGFLQDPEGDPKQFGRLCGLTELPDGSLLIGDDEHGMIYRLSYGNAKRPPVVDTTKLTEDLVNGPRTLTVRVPTLALKNTEYGPGRAVSPAVAISGLPAGTRAMAVSMDDPDAAVKPITHWLLADVNPQPSLRANLAPGDRSIYDVTAEMRAKDPANAPKLALLDVGGVQGGTSSGRVGYYGPKPPVGDPPHAYHLTVYALDGKLGLKPGFNRMGLVKAMQGHVLAQGTVILRFGK